MINPKGDKVKFLSVSQIMSSILRNNDENAKINSIWQRERSNAAKFGPSHVAEIDAIFSRQV